MTSILERASLLLGGAFIALGAEMRGWINYSRDVEFWLMGAFLGLLFASEFLRRNAKNDATETANPAAE
ncbi:hypothetical protein IDJ81_01070 [Tsuneonella flava]|uniref:Uncharacterized protein n=1 Tax=Tsuneonella flava TaxID=2055955 RepID=A0ABX7KBA6_9SPHN|nr:hypothetical protein [Tsuneonella flava]QSB44802.1 hypothetical protein IDJ81_01070 [Tsuneonella flava]